ncbi:hypothetical protein [Calothrix sp. 336/3]|uniref:hypothetical protein n=1 Tax=Calothrix sp. 336/3 TaxID=1337936 RepID=UPI0004E38B3D|nr:hypothetical protein [Calothrix sp. 336/3]AKG20716.1 hypothetical protein IJ00_04795 [Calothrix sp. 336/3]
MKILLISVGWAIALGLGTFFFTLTSMAFQVSPEERMSQLTTYGLTTGIIGGVSLALVMLWSQPGIQWHIALLFVLIWSLSLLVGSRIGWHIIQPDFSSQAMGRGVIIGMTIGGILGGFFTALLLQQTRILVSWLDICFVALGWTIALFSGFAFIFLPGDWNFIPMGIMISPIIGGLLIGAIGSSIMFWKMH